MHAVTCTSAYVCVLCAYTYTYIVAEEKLNLNVTSSLIYTLKATQATWRQDLGVEEGGEGRERQPLTSATTSLANRTQEESSSSTTALGVPRQPSQVKAGLALLHSVRFVNETRQRTRFVPFLLRNNTGVPLRFTSLTSLPSRVYVNPAALYQRTRGRGGGGRGGGGVIGENLDSSAEWMDVQVGEERPFDFNSRNEQRRRVSL